MINAAILNFFFCLCQLYALIKRNPRLYLFWHICFSLLFSLMPEAIFTELLSVLYFYGPHAKMDSKTFFRCFILVYLLICLISWSSSERAIGKVPLRFEESASGPGNKAGGTGAGPSAWGVHCHWWCADLPGLPLWVPRGLVRAPAPQVRKCFSGNEKTFPFWIFFFPLCPSETVFLVQLSQSEVLNLYQPAPGALFCSWLRHCSSILAAIWARGNTKIFTQTFEMNKLLGL